ncbi:MAG: hypothetical protein HY775_09240 [Acidobacteria bacterium]|nr:hypothetical protein [Acidobacteriota bacterium]
MTAVTRPRAAPPAGPPPESPARGGTLRVLLAEDVDSLDPQLAGRPSSWFFARVLHRGLMAFPSLPGARGRTPVPDLAAAPPSVSADGLTYRFRIRPGARFGPPASRALTSADVRAGLVRLLRLRPEVASYFDVIAGGSRGISTPDSRTVTLRLLRPSNDLPWMLALPQASAVPEELAGRSGVAPEAIAPSGPYRLEEYLPERRLRLARNPAWSAASDPVRRAWVDEIEATVGLSQKAIDARIAAGTADLQADSPAVGTGVGDRVVTAPNGCLRYLWMNTTVKPFDRVAVRRAIALAVDRAAAAAAGPPGRAAAGILPPTVAGSSTEAAPRPDPSAARQALRVQGLPGGFATTLVVGDTELDRRQAAAVARSLSLVGVRAKVRAIAISRLYPDWYERPARRVPMGIATWCADWPGLAGRAVLGALLDPRRIRAEANTVYSMLRSRAIERAIDAASAAPRETAAGLWLAADRAARDLAAVVPLAWLDEAVRLGSRVAGFVAHPLLARGDPSNLWLRPRARTGPEGGGSGPV